MLISDILRRKGSTVVTISADATVTELVASLAEHKIGALIVVEDGQTVGIVSERDVVRRLHQTGGQVLDLSVSELMTTSVISCGPTDKVDDIAAAMTERRIRHMPVLTEGELSGIVTIGDVVAARIADLEQAQGQLESYITQG
ncbi:MAG TPA: CBS domain-containing protein [Jatrophihabitans sp.]|jgi:CBS domain-containing protein|uniref:CBS domain-containing protein n=1 Tax=Jatrophihabitans sp. TaxID=1932789 RepID=UPI002EF7441B